MTDITAGDGVEGWLKRADRDLRALKTATGRARVPRTCTSTTRPDPSSYQPGVPLFETDTGYWLVVNATQTDFLVFRKYDAPATGQAPLASPVFTGDPQAPTPASTDSDTSIATTAFVRGAMGLFGVGSNNRDVSGGDWNNQITTGFFMGSNMGNTNWGTDWCWMTIQRHSDQWVSQTAIVLTGINAGIQFQRNKYDNSWKGWTSVLGGASGIFQGGAATARDWNGITASGIYNVNRGGGDAGAANYPGGSGQYGQLIVFNAGSESVTQMYEDGANLFVRRQYDGGWSGWRTVITNYIEAGLPWQSGFYDLGETKLTKQGRIVTLSLATQNDGGSSSGQAILQVPDGWQPQATTRMTMNVYNGGWRYPQAVLNVQTDRYVHVEDVSSYGGAGVRFYGNASWRSAS